MRITKRPHRDYMDDIGLNRYNGNIKNGFACLFFGLVSLPLFAPLINAIDAMVIRRIVMGSLVVFTAALLFTVWKSVPVLDFLSVSSEGLRWRIAFHSGHLPLTEVEMITRAGAHLMVSKTDGTCVKMKNCAARFDQESLKSQLKSHDITLIEP